ncbi:MAG TPA: sugar ABC transporter substrate-binding protein [Chloroflexota bacterium]|nr:sugar ABC transporter substrate-binding protein [Chloroflexota bacterium]
MPFDRSTTPFSPALAREVSVATRAFTRRHTLRRAAAVASVGVAGTLSACGAAGQEQAGAPQGQAAPQAQLKKGATVTWAVDSGPTRTPLRQDQTKLFKDKFPDINVEFVEGATGTEKLQTLFAAGTPPDLFRQETAGMAHFASRGQAASLDAFLKRDKYDLSDFFPAAWELWKWKGKYYGVPFLGIRLAFYNRSLIQQSGGKTPPASWRDNAWTWDAFLEASKKVSRQGTRWGADLGTGRRDWQPWVWNNGGDLFNADGTQVLLDQPAAVESIQFLTDLIHKHRVAPTADELKEAGGRGGVFQAGNLFLYHSPVNNIATNRDKAGFDWSITGLPKGKGKVAYSSGGGVGWFLANDSKVKDETWELMKVLASKEGVRMEAERGEAPPSRRSIAKEPAFISPPEPPKGDMKVVVDALEAMHLETALLNGVEIDRILDEELKPVWAGQKTAREALAQATSRIKPLLNPAG